MFVNNQITYHRTTVVNGEKCGRVVRMRSDDVEGADARMRRGEERSTTGAHTRRRKDGQELMIDGEVERS